MSVIKNSVSIVTYNIHKGFGAGKLRFLLPQMRTALSGLSPDFVFLQEVQGLHTKREQRIEDWPDLSQFEYMAERDWPHYLYAKNAIYAAGHHGNAILSKYAFDHYENINLSTINRASRSLLHAQVRIKRGNKEENVHLICVHLGLFKRERSFQCSALMQQIRQVVPTDEPLIMAGDFNDWRNHLSKPLSEELGIEEAFNQVNGHYARTFPAIRPALRVDRIYYRGLNIRDVICMSGKPWRTLSDHLPLCARFEFD